MNDRDRLREALADPVLWGQMVLRNRDGSPRSFWPHQVEDMRAPDRHIVHLDGRDTGKSISISTQCLHYAMTHKGGQGLVAAPFQGQLDMLIDEIEFQFDRCPELASSLAVNRFGQPKITRKPYYKIEFKNDAVLYFRPAGAYGSAFRSLHVERVWVDEGAWLPEQAWKALRQCLKTGGRMRVYSTPNGIRDTTYYRLTNGAEGWRVFRWPSWINPTWNEERERDLLTFYGGRDSAGWQHEVAGEHGKPAYGAFHAESLAAAQSDIPEFRRVMMTGDDLQGLADEAQVYDRLELMLGLIPQQGVFWLGGDTGYTQDPTELVVFREQDDGLLCVFRLHMEHVQYPNIAQAIALLDKFYCFTGIGIDNGGNGTAIVHELLTLDKYRAQDFGDRVTGFDFGGVTTMEMRDREIRKRTKELMTSLIGGLLQRGQIKFSSEDHEAFDQFSSQTYTLQNGYVVYSKGNDHIVDAVRCAVLKRELAQSGGPGSTGQMAVPVSTDPVFT